MAVRPRRVSVPVIKVMRRYSVQPPLHFHSVDCAEKDAHSYSNSHSPQTTSPENVTDPENTTQNLIDLRPNHQNSCRRSFSRYPCPPVILESDDDVSMPPTSQQMTSSRSFNVENHRENVGKGCERVEVCDIRVTLSDKRLRDAGVEPDRIASL